jgi:hypothetical protein
VELSRGGVSLQGYPALVDEGESVAPRISTARVWPRALTGWACAG